MVVPTANWELGGCTELRTVDDVLRAPWPVPASETVALQQRVGGSTDRNSVTIGCESYIDTVQLVD